MDVELEPSRLPPNGRGSDRTGSVVGIESSPAMIARAIKKAKKAGGNRFENGLAESLSFPDARFDVALGAGDAPSPSS